MIIKAVPDDHLALSQLTKLSKAHWGYSREQITLWTDDLTITAEYISNHPIFKLYEQDLLIGYYSYQLMDAQTIELDNLFIHPNYIGKGFGKFLMEDFLARVSRAPICCLRLYSEPNAEVFYKKFGFEVIGQHQSSIPNRFLPIMEKRLEY